MTDRFKLGFQSPKDFWFGKDLARCFFLAAFAGILGVCNSAGIHADEIRFERNSKERVLKGEIVVESQDGGVLFKTPDGKLWLIQPGELRDTKKDGKTPENLDSEQLGEAVLKDLPDGFRVYTTTHYVICYNTSKAYAKWIGSLYERLYRGYLGYWNNKRKWELKEPGAPLAIILFKDKAEYKRFVERELGEAADSMVAYYNLLTNRVAMYDLTGLADATDTQIARFVRQDSAYSMVATIVHEGTHQLVFNTGLQTRLADTPLWVNEGLAMYFETPDTSSSNGWRGIGIINRPRLIQLRRNMSQNKWIRLADLIGDDRPFQNTESSTSAYSAAWALNYYLFKKYPKQYVTYLQKLGEGRPLVYEADEEKMRKQRLELFEKHIGKDIADIEKDFYKYVRYRIK